MLVTLKDSYFSIQHFPRVISSGVMLIPSRLRPLFVSAERLTQVSVVTGAVGHNASVWDRGNYSHGAVHWVTVVSLERHLGESQSIPTAPSGAVMRMDNTATVSTKLPQGSPIAKGIPPIAACTVAFGR